MKKIDRNQEVLEYIQKHIAEFGMHLALGKFVKIVI